MHFYSVYGLTVSSEIMLDLSECSVQAPNVFIQQGFVPEKLEETLPVNSIFPTVRFQVKDNSFLLVIDGVARYLVQNGDSIYVFPDENADNKLIRLFLIGSAFGALLFQRQILPLHGSSILTSKGAVLFCGASGNGKSTLAAAFERRGYSILSDDVSAITFANGSFYLMPASPNIYLHQDTLAKLDINSNDVCRSAERDDKYQLRISTRTDNKPTAIHSIYMLEPGNFDAISILALSGFKKISALINNTYRIQFVASMNLVNWHFEKVAEISAQTRILNVKRPIDSDKITGFVDAIELDWKAF